MRHGYRHHPGHRHGFHRFGRLDRGTLLQRLEEYQKDLEQEIADVADLIRRLREEPAQTQTQSI